MVAAGDAQWDNHKLYHSGQLGIYVLRAGPSLSLCLLTHTHTHTHTHTNTHTHTQTHTHTHTHKHTHTHTHTQVVANTTGVLVASLHLPVSPETQLFSQSLTLPALQLSSVRYRVTVTAATRAGVGTESDALFVGTQAPSKSERGRRKGRREKEREAWERARGRKKEREAWERARGGKKEVEIQRNSGKECAYEML